MNEHDYLLAKQKVVGSNPIVRSNSFTYLLNNGIGITGFMRLLTC